ncbi:PilC/PilY family type IV pilus protein [Marinobacter algicola]|uniref:Tfp pilus assembly protein tip-associated adhesin PilY1-like protein n=1 Tax=Marinobacter algicola DG893 TaxID=443152 RepID=A6F486_9GAMM|nr:PilC/PilY family type IV pilus protein [Marinobacter algicola]EDM46434.1 Tfp pilus assembly protein tip-associated adhesin PilY1-like protein [Marinobacter algicola DG893]
MKYFSNILTTVLSAAYFTMAGTAAIADDTEIFFTDADGVVKPNIMFILDVSGSMGTADVGGKTRLRVMKDVTKDLFADMEDVNVGLMVFGGNEGGYFKSAVSPIENKRAALIDSIEDLSDGGNTPLSETLFQSMRYFQGEDYFIRYWDEPYQDANGNWVADVPPGVTEDGKYKSPIEYECQPNSVVLLTDGEPTEDTNHEGDFEAVLGSGACVDNCLDEIAGYMWENDMIPPSNDPDDDFRGDQRISTYTVGFKTDQKLLGDAAAKGNGTYFKAENAASLKSAFDDLFTDVLARSTTFAAPGIAVNTFDRLNHLDSLYFAVFQPDTVPLWDGNLKRYRLGVVTNDTTGEKEAVILDADGNEAVDPTTGFFSDVARSWWSPAADGKEVGAGGAASQHEDPNSNRNVYTYVASSNKTSLTAVQNKVVATNSNITAAMLGDPSMSNTDRSALIDWIRGQDLDDSDNDGNTEDSRKFIADPLHSVPHLIVYGGTADSPTTAVFFGDNQGFIHGISGESGNTHFSFIPEELFPNQASLKTNKEGEARTYGMDGTIVSWVFDDDFDGQINDGDDHAYIYSGMRRGGSSYYGLDVTDPGSPSFLWQIEGGVTGGSFEELGQTWSTPTKTKVKISNKQYEVLIFGGGYDTNQDNVDVRTPDSVGRAIYIVDAETGDRLWWAGPTGSGADLELATLEYSIPSAPKVIDVTGDGRANQIYIGDMGGQIFRFDITNGNSASTLVTGGRIADLAGTGASDARRFYHAPDIFGIKIGGARYLGLAIGSGYQAHPLDEAINDRFYMLRMPDVTSPPVDADGNVDYTALTEASLYNATDNLIQDGVTEADRAAAAEALGNSKGWYISLNNTGEKVLSTSQTINNEIFFTTYEPTPSTNPCVPAAGTSRLYHVSALDSRAVVNYDESDGADGTSDDLTVADRFVELNTIGLPPNPQRMRVDDTDIVCVGAECRTVDSVVGVVETYWFEE